MDYASISNDRQGASGDEINSKCIIVLAQSAVSGEYTNSISAEA